MINFLKFSLFAWLPHCVERIDSCVFPQVVRSAIVIDGFGMRAAGCWDCWGISGFPVRCAAVTFRCVFFFFLALLQIEFRHL